MIALTKSEANLQLGHVGSKTRSLGQFLEKACVHSRGHIFRQILISRGWNVSPVKILDEFENVSCGVRN